MCAAPAARPPIATMSGGHVTGRIMPRRVVLTACVAGSTVETPATQSHATSTVSSRRNAYLARVKWSWPNTEPRPLPVDDARYSFCGRDNGQSIMRLTL